MSETYLQFGAFRLKVGLAVWRNDKEIPLPPKEQALLEMLAQNSGEVVGHTAIYNKLWPRQSIGYPSLARCVYSLRKAMGSEGKKLIKTVPKRGYKLSVPVENINAQSFLHSHEGGDPHPLARAHLQAGMSSLTNPSAEALERAIHWFEASIKADPGYVAAYEAQAAVRLFQSVRGFLHPQDAFRKGSKSCNEALKLDPNAVHAIGLSGWFKAVMGGNLEEGMKCVKQALELDPELSKTYVYQSWIYRAQGNLEAALECTSKAVKLDPHALFNRHAHAYTLFQSGRYAEALVQENWVLSYYPEDDIAQGYKSLFLAGLGRHQEALDDAYLGLDLAKLIPSVWGGLAWCLVVCGERKEARRLVKLAYEADQPRCPRPLILPALVALGQTDRAFALLQEAREEQCPWFFGIRADPRLAELRGDRRWQALYN